MLDQEFRRLMTLWCQYRWWLVILCIAFFFSFLRLLVFRGQLLLTWLPLRLWLEVWKTVPGRLSDSQRGGSWEINRFWFRLVSFCGIVASWSWWWQRDNFGIRLLVGMILGWLSGFLRSCGRLIVMELRTCRLPFQVVYGCKFLLWWWLLGRCSVSEH